MNKTSIRMSLVALATILPGFAQAAPIPYDPSGPYATGNNTIIQYNMDSSSGSTLIDAADPVLDGNNSGTLTGSDFSWVAGQTGFGNALQLTPVFDGNGTITSSSIATASITGTILPTLTMAAWVNPAGVTGGGGSYVMGLTGGGRNSFIRFDGSFNEIVRTGYIVDGGWREVAYALPGGFAGEWNHVASTYDNGTVTLYVNGVKVGENTEKAGFGAYYAETLVVSATPWDTSYKPSAYSGLVDDMRVMNVAVVPEPSSMAMLGLAAAAGVVLRRRRQS